MTVEEIAAVTGTTAAGVRAVLKADMPKPLPAWLKPAREL
jgi:predicted transcriptional regulator